MGSQGGLPGEVMFRLGLQLMRNQLCEQLKKNFLSRENRRTKACSLDERRKWQEEPGANGRSAGRMPDGGGEHCGNRSKLLSPV